MRFQDLDLNNNLSKRSDGVGYSEKASYSRKEGVRKGLLLGGQLLGMAGVSYLTGWLARELYYPAMVTKVDKFKDESIKMDTPVRIPSYDKEGEEFYLNEYKMVGAETVYYHDIFVERLKELPIIGKPVADLIENTQNAIMDGIVKEYGPSITLAVANNEAQYLYGMLLWSGMPAEEAYKQAIEFYEKLLANPQVRDYADELTRQYIAKPISTYKIAAIEADVVGSITGATTFMTLSSLVFGDEIKSGLKKACSGPKHLYDKILTGGKKETDEDEDEEAEL